MAFEEARSLVQAELQAIDQFITNELRSDVPLINQIMEYILKCGGKRIRPLVLILSAKAFNHQGHHPIHLAAVIELIHTATLLHDDVVDHSTLRRGHKTANILWGNEASVLVGDFLYSRAFQVIVELRSQRTLDMVAHATHYIAEGEMLQLVHAHNPDTSEEMYFDIIRRKTAKLFAVAAELGVVLLEREDKENQAMRNYGMDLGLAYQLIDDVLDYRNSAEQTGKNIGNDLAEGKTTLPLIYALQKGTPAEVKLLQKAIKKGETRYLQDIMEIIVSTGAIQYTAQAARQYAQKACAVLTHVPSSPYRQALHDLADFVVQRSY